MPSVLPYELRKRMPQCAPKRVGGWAKYDGPPPQEVRCQYARNKPESRGATRVGQCKLRARKGTKYCRVHSHRDSAGESRFYNKSKVPDVYKVIGRALGDRMKQLEAQEAAALQLRIELQLTRATADEAVEQYDAAREMRDACECALQSDPENEALQKAAQKAFAVCETAGAQLRVVLEQVADMAERAARLEATRSGQFSVMAVRHIMSQVAMLMWEVCGEEHVELARQFELAMGQRIRIEVPGSNGVAGVPMVATGVTPDMDVLDVVSAQVAQMDGSVPR